MIRDKSLRKRGIKLEQIKTNKIVERFSDSIKVGMVRIIK
jgi:hypothetical protein